MKNVANVTKEMKILKNCNAQNITLFLNILIQKFAFFFPQGSKVTWS